MSKTLIVGDIHLGKLISIGKHGVGSALNSRIVDQSNLLDWILEQAVDRNVTAIILTGDIFEDVKPEYTLTVIFLQWLKKCESCNIDVHIIAGNHDIKRTGNHYTSALDIIMAAEINNIFVYKQIDTIYNGDVGFTLVPFRDRRSFNSESASAVISRLRDILLYESKEIPSTYDKVLIGHLALEGSICVGDEFDDTANELMCPIDMFSDYNFTWMGHVHKPQVRGKNPHVAHIGSLDISDFGETDHQKILILFDSSLPGRFEEILVPSRPLRRVRISSDGPDTTKLIINAVEEIEKTKSLKNAIVKIEVQLLGTDALNADREQVELVVYGAGAFHISSFIESRSISVVPVEKQKDLDSAISPRLAVKMYSDFQPFESEEDKETFIQLSNQIIEEYGSD